MHRELVNTVSSYDPIYTYYYAHAYYEQTSNCYLPICCAA